MIVIDTSAIMAIALDEAEAERCIAAIAANEARTMSAVTMTELMIVAGRRNRADEVEAALKIIRPQIAAVTEDRISQIVATYARWGKGIHPASLNICDCFAYALAMEMDCPLLFVGDDFAQTDVKRVVINST